ncbi:unnamed protein product [Penicillium bialowiezense]
MAFPDPSLTIWLTAVTEVAIYSFLGLQPTTHSLRHTAYETQPMQQSYAPTETIGPSTANRTLTTTVVIDEADTKA